MRVMRWNLKDEIFTLDDPKRVAESLKATAERDARSDRAENWQREGSPPCGASLRY
jgi:hypothetical protein